MFTVCTKVNGYINCSLACVWIRMQIGVQTKVVITRLNNSSILTVSCFRVVWEVNFWILSWVKENKYFLAVGKTVTWCATCEIWSISFTVSVNFDHAYNHHRGFIFRIVIPAIFLLNLPLIAMLFVTICIQMFLKRDGKLFWLSKTIHISAWFAFLTNTAVF